jgi:hypothetical protein
MAVEIRPWSGCGHEPGRLLNSWPLGSITLARSTADLTLCLVVEGEARHGLQQLIELEVAAVIGADRHERTEERLGYRNGYRSHSLTTQVGDIDLLIPKLRAVPAVHLHEPWTMTPALQERIGCVLGLHYPLPIVEPTAAARQARQRIWAQRQQPGFKELAGAINQEHGSRRSNLAPRTGQRRRRSTAGNAASSQGAIQLGLDLDLDLD